MIVVFAPNRELAAEAARKRGLKPERQCVLVWNAEAINLTCLQDYVVNPIEVDLKNVSEETKRAWAIYLDIIVNDSRKGFGWRNWWNI